MMHAALPHSLLHIAQRVPPIHGHARFHSHKAGMVSDAVQQFGHGLLQEREQ
jgi:hypothetical protein